MDWDSINKQYWSKLLPQDIMSGVHFPGNELLDIVNIESHILDIGCGQGKVSNFLFEKGFKVTGIDINETAINKNKHENNKINFVYADITNEIPFPDGHFDVITIPYVLVSIINNNFTLKAIQEITRVLKNDGLVWVCEAIYSKDYKERYKDAFNKTGLKNIAFSYLKNINFKEEKVKRVIKHFSIAELDELFKNFQKLYSEITIEKSPSSGLEIQTAILIYKK